MSLFRKTIELCPNCNEPLVWTFINPGCEWYCINCKDAFPMFCDSVSIEYDNPKFKYYEIKQRIYKNIFKAISKDFIPKRCYRNGCKLCEKREEYHYQHLTDLEKVKDKISREILNKIRFNKK